MIKYRFSPKNKTMEFKIGGKVTEEEFDQTIRRFQRDIAKHDQLKLIEVVDRIDSVAPLALFKDIMYGVKRFGEINKKIKKAAIVAEQKWIKWGVKAFSPWLKIDVKYFERAKEKDAREWLKAS